MGSEGRGRISHAHLGMAGLPNHSVTLNGITSGGNPSDENRSENKPNEPGRSIEVRDV